MESPSLVQLPGMGRRFLLPFAVWTLLGIFDASHSYLRYAYRGTPIGWGQALALGLSLWYAWGLLAVVVFRFARRFPIEQRVWPRRVAVHIGAGAFVAAVKIAMDYPIIEAFYCPLPGLMNFFSFLQMGFISQFHKYVLIYWALLGVCHAINYNGKYQERELKAAQLETRLAQLQLQFLKMQLQPHFLFNTLHSISALIHKDTEVADRMVARLGDLLRLTLEHNGAPEVSLREELEFTQAYLEIEQARYGNRLTVRTKVDSTVLDARVPYMLLQPLVENSIRHGIAPTGKPGRIEIRAQPIKDCLRLQVWDNGPGLPDGVPKNGRHGIGLANTRARLHQLYGNRVRLEFCNGTANGLLVTIDLPLRREAESLPEGELVPLAEDGRSV